VVLGTVGADQSASFFDERGVEFAHPPAQLCWAAAGNRIVLAELSRRAAVAVICGRACAAVMATIGDRDRRSRLSLAAGMFALIVIVWRTGVSA
jgi:hypothetical protein